MSLKELELRLAALEAEVRDLKAGPQHPDKADPKWVLAHAGRFENDPGFDEIVRLGREYRESTRPGRKKPAATRKAKRPVNNGRA
jgi:hypothetical protein